MPLDDSLPEDALPDDPEIPEDDLVLQAELSRALARYQHLPPEALQTMRETLIDALTTHPVGLRLLNKARTAARVARSGTREKDT